jgi:hypothetical protein
MLGCALVRREENLSSQTFGQVVWLQAPFDGSDGARVQLANWNPDKTRTVEPKVYILRKSHPAFNDNYGLLIALALQGHRLTLVTEPTDGSDEVGVLVVGIGTKAEVAE